MLIENDELRRIQKIELAILLYFDQFCRQNKIDYFMGGGTLLGAVRHGGFIPWDDDIDVMMTRENYDRLHKIAMKGNYDQRFFFQLTGLASSYHDYMAKLRLNNTVYATNNNLQFERMHKGFFIDIFPHDATSNNKTMQQAHIFLTKLTRSMVYHKWFNTPMQHYGRHELACKVFTGIIKVLPISLLEHIRDTVITWFRKNNKCKFFYDGCGMHLDNGVFDKSILSERIMIPFEGYLLPAPKQYDEYLRFSYGDNYMELPPEEERVPHHDIAKIDFGDVNLDEFFRTE